jgi:excisionase family DNA binding protein
MTVKDIKDFLGIGHVQAYKLANSGEFKVTKIGRMIRIPRPAFLEWLEHEKGKESVKKRK